MTPRRWTTEEVELVQLVANRCWESLDRARLAHELRESENRLRALVSASSDIVFAMSPDWSELRRLHGRDYFDDVESPEQSWMETYIHSDDHARVREAVTRAVRARDVLEVEHRVRRRDGTITWLFSRAVPILDEHGQVEEWFGAATDITARREAEQTLLANEMALKEADRRKDEFLAMLAHELRNPLAPIGNALQAMRISSDDATRHRAQDVMERQLGHMVRLVDDLLDVSRITRGKVELRREVVLLSEIIDSALETTRPHVDRKKQMLHVSIPLDVSVEGDKARLAQVFANILNNASNFTGEGGTIDVDANEDGGSVVVEVRDDGIGIPPDKVESVFDIFAQVDSSLDRSSGGLGIGLTVVRTLVEMHGGRVHAISEGLGHGTTVRVELPRLAGKSDAAPGTAGDGAPASSPLRLLVVDDNRDSAETLGMMLELLGHKVRVEYDGPSAVEAVQRERPDLVFLDIGMPGMNGFEVCRRIKASARTRDVPVVAQTGWGDGEQRARSHEAGFDEHLVKPVDVSTLQEVLARFRSGAHAADGRKM